MAARGGLRKMRNTRVNQLKKTGYPMKPGSPSNGYLLPIEERSLGEYIKVSGETIAYHDTEGQYTFLSRVSQGDIVVTYVSARNVMFKENSEKMGLTQI